MTSPFTIEEHPLLEHGSCEDIAEQTNRLLIQHIQYLASRSPFYKRLFSLHGICPQDISSVNDLAGIPFTTKHDLEEYNSDFLCVPECEVVDICQTSGTTGQPVSLALTENDLERLAYNEWRSFTIAGLTRNDRVLLACTLDRCFMAGMAYFLGLRRLGATIIRAGGGSAVAQAEAICVHRPTVIVGVPTQCVAIAELLVGRGIDPAALGLRKIIGIGEPVRRADFSFESVGKRLRDMWGVDVHGTYASTEMATAFTECSAFAGGHLQTDLIHIEIVDVDGIGVAAGTMGEVVATPLQSEGMPLLRVQTGDIATLHVAPCQCGRTTPRIGPVVGRKNQMLKCRGTTVYPPAICSVLQELHEVRAHFVEVFDDCMASDRLKITVAMKECSALTPSAIEELVSARIRVRPEVVFASIDEVMSRTVVPTQRKPVRFFDYRARRCED